jgi:hypothetical protein
MKKLLPFIILILACSLAAQVKKRKSITKPKTQLTELTNETEGCYKSSFSGTIVKRNFDEDEITLSGFVLRESDDNRIYVNVDHEYLSNKGRFELSNLASTLTLNRRVKISVYGCGTAGALFWLYSLQAY